MRDSNFNSQVFCVQLDSLLANLSEKHSELLSRIVPSALQGKFENSFVFKQRSLDFLVRVSILSWYVPEELGILLRFQVQERITNNANLDWLQLLLDSKSQMLLFLLDTKLWHTRDFFGNLLNDKLITNTLVSITPKFESKKRPNRPERHRGYRDHGNLKFPHEVHECGEYRPEHLKLEEERRDRHNTYLFMLGFLGISPGG